MLRFVVLTGTVLMVLLGCKPQGVRYDPIANTLFKFGFRSPELNTGPLENSGFVFRFDEKLPPVFITAHHCVARSGGRVGYSGWNEIDQHFKHGWAFSMHQKDHQFALLKSLPIAGAATMKLDVAAFSIEDTRHPALLPAKHPAVAGDTVNLLSRLIVNGDTTLLNPARVIYASDSIVVYKLLAVSRTKNVMTGTSGSPVLDRDHRVISNSFGGFMYPDAEQKGKISNILPLIDKLPTVPDSVYGIGVPVRLIVDALKASTTNPDKH